MVCIHKVTIKVRISTLITTSRITLTIDSLTTTTKTTNKEEVTFNSRTRAIKIKITIPIETTITIIWTTIMLEDMPMIIILMAIKDRITVTSITNTNGLLITIEMTLMQVFNNPITIDKQMVLEVEILEVDINSNPIIIIMVLNMVMTIDKTINMMLECKRIIEILSKTWILFMIMDIMVEIIIMTSMVQFKIQVSSSTKMVVTIEINRVPINNNGSKIICIIDQIQIEVEINISFIINIMSI